MSIRVLSDVFDHFPAGGNELLLALAIADFAADDGTRIYPSVTTLAAKTRLSKRTVQYMLRDLEERDWLQKVADGGGLRAAEYRINPAWIAARGNYVLRDPKTSNTHADSAPPTPMQDLHPTHAASCTPPMQELLHDPHAKAVAPYPSSNRPVPASDSSSLAPSPADAGSALVTGQQWQAWDVGLELNTGKFWRATPEQVAQLQGLYPAVDIHDQFRRMAGWLSANPNNRKTERGVMRFVNAWLSRAQDRAPARPAAMPQQGGFQMPQSKTGQGIARLEEMKQRLRGGA